MDWITQPEAWIALLTLISLELVLGVDNVIFISILAGKLPVSQQQRARTTGISMAVITRSIFYGRSQKQLPDVLVTNGVVA